jgi:hypothetical protein
MLQYLRFEYRTESSIIRIGTGLVSEAKEVLWERWVEGVVWVKR